MRTPMNRSDTMMWKSIPLLGWLWFFLLSLLPVLCALISIYKWGSIYGSSSTWFNHYFKFNLIQLQVQVYLGSITGSSFILVHLLVQDSSSTWFYYWFKINHWFNYWFKFYLGWITGISSTWFNYWFKFNLVRLLVQVLSLGSITGSRTWLSYWFTYRFKLNLVQLLV